MKLIYGSGCVDIEVETEDVGRHYRVSDPGWNESMDAFEVEELQEPETWERLLADLVEDTRLDMVDIVASATLQGLVITLWGCEARKRLALNLLEMVL